MISSNMYQGQSPVGCVFQRTVKTIFEFLTNILWSFKSLSARDFYMPILFNGALENAPYGVLQNPKHYNLTYFSQKLFFNVKIVKKP